HQNGAGCQYRAGRAHADRGFYSGVHRGVHLLAGLPLDPDSGHCRAGGHRGHVLLYAAGGLLHQSTHALCAGPGHWHRGR
nr:hypothetical protein [Tanacetum cinerariifolium]